MARTHKIVHVDPDSELARVLGERENDALLLVSESQRWSAHREPSGGTAAEYDPRAVRAALEPLFGFLHGADIEQLKRELRSQRDDADPVEPPGS